MLRLSRRTLLRGGGVLAATKLLAPAKAGFVLGKVGGGGGGGFVGPLDLTIAPALVAYGQRALSTAKLGSAVYTIRRDSDDTEQTFSSDVTTGEIPVDAILTFLDGANGFGSIWDDQSANNSHVLQADPTYQPPWAEAFVGGSKPCFNFGVGRNIQQLTTASDVSISSGTFTAFAVCFKIDNTFGDELCGMNYDGPLNKWFAFEFYKASPNYQAYIDFKSATDKRYKALETSASSSIILGTPIVYDSVFRGDSHEVLINNEAQTIFNGTIFPTNPPIGIVTGPFNVGFDDTLANNLSDLNESFYGSIMELIIFDGVLSDEDRTAIRQNMATYYGITLS